MSGIWQLQAPYRLRPVCPISRDLTGSLCSRPTYSQTTSGAASGPTWNRGGYMKLQFIVTPMGDCSTPLLCYTLDRHYPAQLCRAIRRAFWGVQCNRQPGSEEFRRASGRQGLHTGMNMLEISRDGNQWHAQMVLSHSLHSARLPNLVRVQIRPRLP